MENKVYTAADFTSCPNCGCPVLHSMMTSVVGLTVEVCEECEERFIDRGYLDNVK